ncbi:hypothetical protein OF83DRAFT_1111600 [Amylostereum chailletii]|nr:hypothetical protein OF83DRAFT_1111600 [Amylostereum chailletii]
MAISSTKPSRSRRGRARILPSCSSNESHLRTLRVKQVRRRKTPAREDRIARRAPCSQWAVIGQQTAGIVLGDGKYVETRRCRASRVLADMPDISQSPPPPVETTWHILHDISAQVRWSIACTALHNPETILPPPVPLTQTRIHFSCESSLAVARRHSLLSFPAIKGSVTPARIGVLSSASSRRPGGGFNKRSSNHDAILSRSTSLIAPLSSPVGRTFYRGAIAQPSAMLYSPQVVGIRKDDDDSHQLVDDDFDGELDAIPADPTTAGLEQPPAVDGQTQRSMGEFVAPYAMNVLSAHPVRLPRSPKADRDLGVLRTELKSRLARALAVFAAHGDAVLVLTPFGCEEGVSVDVVAQTYAELLACVSTDEGSTRFKNVFEEVVFAVPGKLHEPFRTAFEMRVYEDELMTALEV